MSATNDPGAAGARPGWQQSATVALDIGEDRGALVIYPDDRYRGREIEISLAREDGRRVHTGYTNATPKPGRY